MLCKIDEIDCLGNLDSSGMVVVDLEMVVFGPSPYTVLVFSCKHFYFALALMTFDFDIDLFGVAGDIVGV